MNSHPSSLMSDGPDPRQPHSRGILAVLGHYGLILMVGLPGAMVTVVASVYLVVGLGVAPIVVALYVNTTTVLGMLITFYAGRGHIDKRDPALVSVFGLGFLVLRVLTLAAVPWSLWLLVPSALFGAISQLLGPSIFMFDERYRPPMKDADSGMYNTRLVMSLVWIIGPPLAFYIYWLGQFSGVAALSTSFALVSAVAVLVIARTHSQKSADDALKPTLDAGGDASAKRKTTLSGSQVFIIMVLVTSANVLHAIVLPLYLLDSLHATPYLPGWMMALAATTEVAVIFFIPKMLRITSEQLILRTGLALGLVYFALLFVVHDPHQILALQVIYGAHFAASTVVCLGILKTTMKKKKIGSVAAQFLNAGKLGGLIGASLFGLFSQRFGFGPVVTVGGLSLIVLANFVAAWPRLRRGTKNA